MIQCKDFVPEMTDGGGLFRKPNYENIRPSLDRMNEWLDRNGHVRVINVETVTLPNMHDRREEGSEDGSLRIWGEVPATWHQFIRVWYRE
ncbi:MAG: hypothetical protein AAFR61_07700 [Bacteroidota bacterium]